jgi:hypothetical protein
MNNTILSILLNIIQNEKFINSNYIINNNFKIRNVDNNVYQIKYKSDIILAFWLDSLTMLFRKDGAYDKYILEFKNLLYNKFIAENYF